MAIDFNSYTFAKIVEIKGFGVPQQRVAEENKPSQHGATIYSNLMTSRAVSIDGKIKATDATDLQTKLDALKEAMIPSETAGTLTDSESARILTCKAVGLDFVIARPKLLVLYQAQFKAEDPIMYSTTLKGSNITLPSVSGGFSSPLTSPLSSGAVTTGGSYVANNEGNVAVFPSLVKIYGPCVNPQIKNLETGEFVAINTTLAGGDYLSLDFKNRTIMLNGTASRYIYLNSSSDWFQLNTGNNEIRFTASVFAAGYCQFQFRDGYL